MQAHKSSVACFVNLQLLLKPKTERKRNLLLEDYDKNKTGAPKRCRLA